MSPDWRQLDQATSPEWDAAVKGRNASHAVFARSLNTAVSVALDEVSAQILWDLAAFYESISCKVLKDSIVEEQLPPTATALSVF